MRWFLTRDEHYGRTIWCGIDEPRWSRASHEWQPLAGIVKRYATETYGGVWLVETFWPLANGPQDGEIVEIEPPVRMIPITERQGHD